MKIAIVYTLAFLLFNNEVVSGKKSNKVSNGLSRKSYSGGKSYSKGPCGYHSKSSSSQRHMPWDDDRCPKQCFNCGKDCRVYTFAVFDAPGFAQFDGTNVTGPAVELIKEVCKRARKRCEIAFVNFDDCFKNDRSYILDKNVYDVCFSASTPRRESAFSYSRYSPSRSYEIIALIREDSTLVAENFTIPNNYTIVYPSNEAYATTPIIVNDLLNTYQAATLMDVDKGSIIADTNEILDKVESDNETLGFLLISGRFPLEGRSVKELFNLDLSSVAPRPMVRKDEIDILCWWDAFYFDLVCDKEDYPVYCERIESEFGAGAFTCPSEAVTQAFCGNA